ncbi:RNA-directed DNA polymerase, eukaryota, reverse transcriptase zinc-binding domain protein [Tanacetum coccineum]
MDSEENVSSVGVKKGCNVNGNIEKVACGIEEVNGENSVRKEHKEGRVMKERMSSLFDDLVKSTKQNVKKNNEVFGCADNEVNSNFVDKCDTLESCMKNNNDNDGENNRDTIVMSYASMVKNDDIPQNLEYIPTVITEEGYGMHINELMYNIRRMWGKYGVIDIDVCNCGQYLFKFKNEECINVVLDKGPWMVKNTPLFVQKWCPEIGMQKLEPKKFLVWVELMKFPHAKFLPYVISDHTPAILCIPTSIKKTIKTFRFSNFLTAKQEFLDIVKEKWSHEVHGNLFKRVEMLRSQLQEVQTEIDLDPHNHQLRDKEARLVAEFYEAENDEEKFLYQQARINQSMQDTQESDELFVKRLNEGDAEKMIHDITNVEFKNAMFNINDSKATWPYGFTATFFKKAWGIIGSDVCRAVKEFFFNGNMLGQLNAIIVSLIPKVQTLSNVTDFRPIACCNVLYKCISKVITNKIKHVLGSLVSCNQSAFIPGRNIQDNIMITQEIMRGTLVGFGFHERMIHWIMQCVTTTAFTLNVNGERVGYFKGDDLLVMCHGDKISVEVIKKDLHDFSSCSGLLPDNAKSIVFFGSLNEEERNAITSMLSFGTGKLPVRYLGVPLLAKRLSVLESIHVYWASVFLLPATTIKEINKLLKWFLWNQGETAKGQMDSFSKIKSEEYWENTSLWYDNWSSTGLLFKVLYNRSLYDARLKKDLKVSDMICNGEWKWPNEWQVKFPTIFNLEVPMIIADKNDKLVWRTRSGKEVEFSVSIANHDLNQHCPSVQWWKLIWYSQCIPKHSFILWLVIQGRICTQDKLKDWGNQAVNRCCLCLNNCEDLQHLFFQCPFSKTNLINVGNGNNIRSVVRRLVFAASVYNIWHERNRRIFKDVKSSSEEVYKHIMDTVKNKLLGITVKESCAVRDAERKWGKVYRSWSDGLHYYLTAILRGAWDMVYFSMQKEIDVNSYSYHYTYNNGPREGLTSYLGQIGLLHRRMYHEEGVQHCGGYMGAKVGLDPPTGL